MGNDRPAAVSAPGPGFFCIADPRKWLLSNIRRGRQGGVSEHTAFQPLHRARLCRRGVGTLRCSTRRSGAPCRACYPLGTRTRPWSLNIARAASITTGPLRATAGVEHSGRQLATAEARIVGPDDISSTRTVHRISVRVFLGGDQSEDQLDRLVQIAERCPIHRMLVPQVQIQTTRNDAAAHPL
jgi:hypothetical protein